jgi:hypothetical protein
MLNLGFFKSSATAQFALSSKIRFLFYRFKAISTGSRVIETMLSSFIRM